MAISTQDSESSNKRTPMGARAALVFLRLFIVMMTVVLFVGIFYCLLSLLRVAHGEGKGISAITGALGVIGTYMALMATAIACEWMAQSLEARDSPSAKWQPVHPVRMISLPLLLALQIYSGCTILAWLVVKLGGFAATSWIWLGFWSLAFVLSTSLPWFLKRRMPL